MHTFCHRIQRKCFDCLKLSVKSTLTRLLIPDLYSKLHHHDRGIFRWLIRLAVLKLQVRSLQHVLLIVIPLKNSEKQPHQCRYVDSPHSCSWCISCASLLNTECNYVYIVCFLNRLKPLLSVVLNCPKVYYKQRLAKKKNLGQRVSQTDKSSRSPSPAGVHTGTHTRACFA